MLFRSTKILTPLLNDENFVKCLVLWAETVRKTFDDGGTDEIISTRRLVHIAKAYGIFNDRMKAITLCVNRFDTETKEAFLDLYTKVDETIKQQNNAARDEVIQEPATDPNKEVVF